MKQVEAIKGPISTSVFKTIFSGDRGQIALVGFLNSMLKTISEIISAQVQGPRTAKLQAPEAVSNLDVRAILANKTTVEIKLYMVPKCTSPTAAHYLASSWIRTEFRTGGFSPSRRTAIAIILVAEELFPNRPTEFEVSFSLQQNDPGPEVLGEVVGRVQIKFLEIMKASRLWRERKLTLDDMRLGAWLGFLADPSSPAVDEACLYMPELQDAREVLREIVAEEDISEMIY